MKNTSTWLWLALAGSAVLWLASRTSTGQQVVASVTDAVASTVRGMRNRNPGNIRRSGDTWQGQAPQQTDAAFVQFTDFKFGVRAAARVFRNYQKSYGLRTVTALIGRWAPPNENDTGSYVNAVAKRIGVDALAPIDLANAELCYRFLRAVFRHECGLVAETIPEADIREGIALA